MLIARALTGLVMVAVLAVAPSARAAAAARADVTASDCARTVAHGAARSDPRPGTGSGCLFPTGVRSASPSVQVTRAGVLFVAQSSGGVLRSSDHGLTWTTIAVPAVANGDRGSIHGYVHVDPRTDRVYYLTSLLAKSCGLSGAVLSWSDDLGATWTGKTVACDVWDWGRVVTGPAPSGNPYPSAIYVFGVGGRPVSGKRLVYRSLDAGRTWQKMARLASATTEAGAGATAPDGTIYFDYPEFLGFDPGRLLDATYPFKPADYCKQMIAVSEDHGQTWRQEPIPGSKACNQLYGQQRVAVDAKGTVYSVWVGGDDGQVHLAVSRDRARTWSRPIVVTAPGKSFSLTMSNIVAGRAGHVLIAALETSAARNPLLLGVIQGRGEYHAVLTESFDADSAAPHFESADVDPPGDPTLRNGETSTEGNAYLGMSPSDEGWAVFARHSTSFAGPGDLAVARITHP